MTEEISKQIIFGVVISSHHKVLLNMIDRREPMIKEHRALLDKSKKLIQKT